MARKLKTFNTNLACLLAPWLANLSSTTMMTRPAMARRTMMLMPPMAKREWVMKPTKSRETIWHRYQNPENRKIWFACITVPALWCYESEVRPQVHEDGTSCFLFHGKLQKVEDAQPCEMMAARSTAAIQPNTTDGSGAPACTRGETLT